MKNIEVSGKLKKGDRVKIYNQTLGGKEIFEGQATLVHKVMPERYQELWAVEFDEEEHGMPVYRWIRVEDKIEG